jgi:hypothetical protein
MYHATCKVAIAAGIALALCTTAVFTGSAQGSPQIISVEGSFDAGATLTIYGTGFGTKSPARPFLWDDFESGTEGASVQRGDGSDGPGEPTIGHYDRISNNLIYTGTGKFSGDLSAYERYADVYWFNGVVSNWIPTEVPRAFASFVVKLHTEHNTLDAMSCKILRLNTWQPDATHGEPSIVLGERGTGADLEHRSNMGDVTGEYLVAVGPNEFSDPDNKWFSIAVWAKVGDLDVANGMGGREFNGNIGEEYGVQYRRTGLDGGYNGFRSAFFAGHLDDGDDPTQQGWIDLWLDEVYADTTLARVTANDLDKAGVSGPEGGQTAMQIPFEWSDTIIRVTINSGRYNTGDELALVVWDRDGQASPPFAVIVGEASGGGDQGLPGPPSTPTWLPDGN